MTSQRRKPLHWTLKGFPGKTMAEWGVTAGTVQVNGQKQKLQNCRKRLHERLWDMRLSQDKTTRAPTTRLHVTLWTPESNQEKEWYALRWGKTMQGWTCEMLLATVSRTWRQPQWAGTGRRKRRVRVQRQGFSLSGKNILLEIWIQVCGAFGTMKRLV